MAKITELETYSTGKNDRYEPKKALVVYQQVGTNQVYLENYNIHVTKDRKFEFAAGAPVPVEMMEQACKIFLESKSREEGVSPYLQSQGMLPRHILYYRPRHTQSMRLVWFIPPDRRMMYFVPRLEAKDGVAPYPGLIMAVHGNRMRVYAFKGTPSPDSRLYVPPFPNCGPEGGVCLGTAALKVDDSAVYLEDIIIKGERAFFASMFSHDHGGSIKSQEPIIPFWKKLIDTHAEKFPEKELVETPWQLKDLCKDLKE